MKRRAVFGGIGVLAFNEGFSNQAPEYRVAVIGHTGRGNFGHGLDKVWLSLPQTRIVAVADANESGLKKARQRLKVSGGYPDYREMLSEVEPDLVAVCPRHPDQHAAMILAAIEAGAKGIYVEKPFVRTLLEVDQIKSACAKSGTRIAVAHRNRYHPDLLEIDKILRNEGDRKIGRLLEIRGRGKGDRRGGAEDLWVLGTHVLDLVCRFAGKPLSCSASMRKDGEPVTKGDIFEGNEALGPLAGNEVHARFDMENGIVAYWDSIANDGTKNKGFGLQLIGSEGTVIIHCDSKPLAHYRKGNPLDPGNQSDWQVIGNHDLESIGNVHNHVTPCRDLIHSIENDGNPVCGLPEAAFTIEMVMSVFASHFEGGKTLKIPLKTRTHPLENR